MPKATSWAGARRAVPLRPVGDEFQPPPATGHPGGGAHTEVALTSIFDPNDGRPERAGTAVLRWPVAVTIFYG
ncbi:MAG: hypothetical protein WAL90_14815 [Desulfobacterales bacterium]